MYNTDFQEMILQNVFRFLLKTVQCLFFEKVTVTIQFPQDKFLFKKKKIDKIYEFKAFLTEKVRKKFSKKGKKMSRLYYITVNLTVKRV